MPKAGFSLIYCRVCWRITPWVYKIFGTKDEAVHQGVIEEGYYTIDGRSGSECGYTRGIAVLGMYCNVSGVTPQLYVSLCPGGLLFGNLRYNWFGSYAYCNA